MPELGPVLGKGDAMWRALRVLTGEVSASSTPTPSGSAPTSPAACSARCCASPAISFVKGFYRRPFRVGESTFPDGGGRVTELTARPLLNLFYPELAAVQQPLAGEIAARRELLERLPFVTGYGVDIGLLIDAYARARARRDRPGRPRRAPERPPAAAGPRPDGVRGPAGGRRAARARGPAARAAARRRSPRRATTGRTRRAAEPVERPPLRSLRAAA